MCYINKAAFPRNYITNLNHWEQTEVRTEAHVWGAKKQILSSVLSVGGSLFVQRSGSGGCPTRPMTQGPVAEQPSDITGCNMRITLYILQTLGFGWKSYGGQTQHIMLTSHFPLPLAFKGDPAKPCWTAQHWRPSQPSLQPLRNLTFHRQPAGRWNDNKAAGCQRLEAPLALESLD